MTAASLTIAIGCPSWSTITIAPAWASLARRMPSARGTSAVTGMALRASERAWTCGMRARTRATRSDWVAPTQMKDASSTAHSSEPQLGS